MEKWRARDKLVALRPWSETSEIVFLAAFAAEGQRVHHPRRDAILLIWRIELPFGREGPAIGAFERRVDAAAGGKKLVQPKCKDRLTRPLLGSVARIENGFQRRPACFSWQATQLDQPFQPVFEGDWFAPNEDAVAIDINAEGCLHPSRERMVRDSVDGGCRRRRAIAMMHRSTNSLGAPLSLLIASVWPSSKYPKRRPRVQMLRRNGRREPAPA